ncbi:TPA: hypothetical protein I7748_21990, partial [Vibrio vulnificus]|nr:hypothetical protein [Vibrio vulnificus]
QHHELSGGTIREVFAVGQSFTGSNFFVIGLWCGFFFFAAKLPPFPLVALAKSILLVGLETLAFKFYIWVQSQ